MNQKAKPFKLKPNNINTMLRTGYDPELTQMLKEYDNLKFGEDDPNAASKGTYNKYQHNQEFT